MEKPLRGILSCLFVPTSDSVILRLVIESIEIFSSIIYRFCVQRLILSRKIGCAEVIMEAFVNQTGRIVSQMNGSELRLDTKCPISKS